MKTRNYIALSLLVLLLWTTSALAQDAIQKYYSEYADNENFTSVVISSKMFQLFASIDPQGEDAQEFNELVKSLKGIRIVASESVSDARNAFNSAVKKLGTNYEILMSVDEKGEKVRFFIRQEAGKTTELLMIVGGQTKLFIMSITGDIDLQKISSLSKNMNVGGVDYLKNIDDSQKTK